MKKMVIDRNTNIELLRILASVGVILIHYNSIAHSNIYVNNLTRYYLCGLDIIADCSVNLFIIISGFFLGSTEDRKMTKVAYLLAQFVFFRSTLYILMSIVDGTRLGVVNILNLFLPVNYFIILYAVLYIVSPYINIMIYNLNIKEFKKFLFLLFMLFSVETWLVDVLERITDSSYMGLSSLGLHGSQNGFTIVNFILCYCIGVYVRRNYESIQKMSSSIVFAVLILLFVLLSLMNLAKYVINIDFATLNYNNPLIIILATIIYILFCRIKINSVFINRIAKASFTCFILHSSFLPYCRIEKAVNSSILILIIHQVIVAVGLYMLSYVVFLLYDRVLCNVCIHGYKFVRKTVINQITQYSRRR